MQSHVVKFVCDFLVPRVDLPQGGSFHRAGLSWDRRHPENGGTLELDPNNCGLDDFGDITGCTEMAIRPQNVHLKLLKEKDGKQVYEIETLLIPPPGGPTDPEDRHAPPLPVYITLPLRLVTIAEHDGKPMQARFLVLDDKQTIGRIIELHQTRARV